MGKGSECDHDASIEAIRSYFDVLGAAAWDRLAADPPGRASFEVHRRFLARFVAPGMRVLEIGAGPGRFTIVLAELGARVVVTGLSPGSSISMRRTSTRPDSGRRSSRGPCSTCAT